MTDLSTHSRRTKHTSTCQIPLLNLTITKEALQSEASAPSPLPMSMSKAETIHQRQLGSQYDSRNLPAKTPIIGLGCSSFSTFFLKDEAVSSSNHIDSYADGDNNEQASTRHSLLTNITKQADADMLMKSLQLSQSKSHPMIQIWIETIHYAIENGITLLDTAPWYGHGTSEVVIGFAMEKYFNPTAAASTLSSTNTTYRDASNNIRRNDLIINTKVGRYDSDPKSQFDFSYDTTIQSVKRSIQRMKCCYIDVIQLHDPEFAPNMDLLIEETIPALLHCREIKLVKAIGLTDYPLEVQYCILNKVERGIRNNNGPGWSNCVVFDQCLTYCHFNIHSQALFTKQIGSMNKVTDDMKKGGTYADTYNDTSTITNEMRMSFAQYCHSKSIPLMAAAPLSMGLLTHSQPPDWHPAPKVLQQACHNASMIAKEYNVDLPTLSILFALVHGTISCTLLGMANKREVDVALAVVKRVGNTELKNVIEHNINNRISAAHPNNIRNDIQVVLDTILTKDEKKVLNILMDEIDGPFANVWSSGEDEWDGLYEAEKFWSLTA